MNIVKQEEAWIKISKGSKLASKVIGSTFGPDGSNVIIQTDNGYRVSKDGVTVASSIYFSDPVMQIGNVAIQSASKQTVDEAGDGTTQASVLANSLIQNGIKLISEDKGINKIELKKGMDHAYEDADAEIDLLSKSIVLEDGEIDYSLLKQIAYISTNSDEELSSIVAQAVVKAGIDGPVIPVETINPGMGIEAFDGFYTTRLVDPDFYNEKKEYVTGYTRVLISNQTIERAPDIIPIISFCLESQIPVLIIAPSVVGDARSTLMLNIKQIPIGVIDLGPRTTEVQNLIEDLAAYTHSSIIGEEKGITFKDVKQLLHEGDHTFLGLCDAVLSDNRHTIIKSSENKRLLDHISKLEEQRSSYANVNKLLYREYTSRISSLKGNIVNILIGGRNPEEIAEILDRVDDSVRACKSALERGVVAGGGYTLAHVSSILSLKDIEGSSSFIEGYNMVVKACNEPHQKLMENSEIENEVLAEYGHGYNVRKRKKCNLFEEGIIDPAKVNSSALKNAIASAGMLLSTEAVLLNIKTVINEN